MHTISLPKAWRRLLREPLAKSSPNWERCITLSLPKTLAVSTMRFAANFVLRVARKVWRVRQLAHSRQYCTGGAGKGDGVRTMVLRWLLGEWGEKILQLHCAVSKVKLCLASSDHHFSFRQVQEFIKGQSRPEPHLSYPSDSLSLYPRSLYPLFTPISP